MRAAVLGLSWCCTAALVLAPRGPPSPRRRGPLGATRALYPEGECWVDLGGDGGCVKRVLVPVAEGGATPYEGCVCTVLWTAWLAQSRKGWWTRGERVGLQQPNATLEFTVGGGAGEATRSWDLAVPTMARGERCEVVATAEYAFGDGAEPHVPAGARVVFELELVDWSDWAAGLETIMGLGRVDDAEFSTEELQKDLLERREQGEESFLDDLDDRRARIIEQAVVEGEAGKKGASPSLKKKTAAVVVDAALAPAAPVAGRGDGYAWRESEATFELSLDLTEEKLRPRDLDVCFGPRRLEIAVRGEPVIDCALAGDVVPGDCTWAISDDGATLDLYLDKRTRATSMADVWATAFADGSPPPRLSRPKNQSSSGPRLIEEAD